MLRIDRKNKYCCNCFEVLHRNPDNFDCIRIIKFPRFPVKKLEIFYNAEETRKKKSIKDSNIHYRFFLMAPVHPENIRENYEKGIRGHMISYCPFCGENLYTFYGIKRNIECYVNEIKGITF